MLLQELTGFLELIAPPALQEDYDNSGLITGHPQQEITRAIISLDCTEAVIDEAVAEGAELVIAHHPRSEEHTAELQSLMRISSAVFCLKKIRDLTIHNK